MQEIVLGADPDRSESRRDSASPQQGSPLFDHLVGNREQRGRDVEAKRLGGLEVDEYTKLQATVTPPTSATTRAVKTERRVRRSVRLQAEWSPLVLTLDQRSSVTALT